MRRRRVGYRALKEMLTGPNFRDELVPTASQGDVVANKGPATTTVLGLLRHAERKLAVDGWTRARRRYRSHPEDRARTHSWAVRQRLLASSASRGAPGVLSPARGETARATRRDLVPVRATDQDREFGGRLRSDPRLTGLVCGWHGRAE